MHEEIEETKETEQWLLDSNCKLCRRKEYCTKPCKKHKVYTQRIVNSVIASKLDSITGGVFSEIMRRGYNK